MVETLLRAFDDDALLLTVGIHRLTYLCLAAKLGHLDIVKALAMGADSVKILKKYSLESLNIGKVLGH